jgi:PAS domain S-box-containing protein
MGDSSHEWEAKLRETEDLFRTTVENMPVNLVVCDLDGRLLYLNPQLAAMVSAMCGRTPQEIIGLAGPEVWPPPIWTPLREHIERAVATGQRQTYELAADLPNGQRMVREWVVVPLAGPDGKGRRILAMSHDITAQRRLVDSLREADQRKSEFIGILSHELRNPLAAIRTSLSVLSHERSRKADMDWARGAIDRQVSHLVRLVDDLLDVTRIAQNKIRLQRARVDVNQLVREATEDNRVRFEAAGVQLAVQLASRPLHVNADGARVSQVVTNLLSNAVKFTASGGTTTVSVSADEVGHAVLTVADTGSGIDASLLPRVFEPFVQGDHTLDRSGGGLGVGLALVKGLVDLHGGEVRASSAGKDLGARFVVRLPLEVEPAPPPDVSTDEAGVPVRRRVLVIEDDRNIAESLRAVLCLDGHSVEVAHDGVEGLAQARAFEPDVVLCDIGLPKKNGYQVALGIRADKRLRSAYLVALSGYAQAEDLEAARQAGFDEHLAKPASMESVRRALADSVTRTGRTP